MQLREAFFVKSRSTKLKIIILVCQEKKILRQLNATLLLTFLYLTRKQIKNTSISVHSLQNYKNSTHFVHISNIAMREG